MKRIIIIPALLLLFSACHKHEHCKSLNSEIVSNTLVLDDFKKINLEIEADIIYRQADVQSVVIEGPKTLIEKINTSVFQNNLTIDLKGNKCYFKHKPVTIYIETPELELVDIEGSGNFKVENQLNTEDLAIDITGSGDFYADSLNTESMSINIAGSGDVYAASQDTIQEQRIKISGSGDINVINVPCIKTTINISGSGDCKVYALEDLDVKITGSGDVTYRGNPTINTNISGSGSVKNL